MNLKDYKFDTSLYVVVPADEKQKLIIKYKKEFIKCRKLMKNTMNYLKTLPTNTSTDMINKLQKQIDQIKELIND